MRERERGGIKIETGTEKRKKKKKKREWERGDERDGEGRRSQIGIN